MHIFRKEKHSKDAHAGPIKYFFNNQYSGRTKKVNDVSRKDSNYESNPLRCQKHDNL